MGAYDTSLTPVSVTPNSTSDTTLDPDNNADAFVYVTAVNLSAVPVAVRIGITPSGGAVAWQIAYDLAIPGNDAIDPQGPYFLQAGDVITVRTASADDVTFGLTGVESS